MREVHVMSIWNPWHGCKKLSPGCANCYVYRRDESIGKNAGIVSKTGDYDLPLKRNRKKEFKLTPEDGVVYACMTSDFFLEEADEWRPGCWDMIRERKELSFYIITKRIDRFEKCMPPDWGEGWEHVTICSTCENQDRADYRLPILLDLPIRHRQIISEPMLEEIHFEKYLATGLIEHVTCGGESGPNARPCDFQWIKEVRRECIRHGVPFYFKQTGAVFIMNGKTYHIDRKDQMVQARKSGYSYTPGTGSADLIYYHFPKRDELFRRLCQSDFRSRFHLNDQERKYVAAKGLDVIHKHAEDFVEKRLSPENPENDGKQTPMKGHPVFIAQHATACCCRGCLEKWHNIPAGKKLTKEEQSYVVDVLMDWICREQGVAPEMNPVEKTSYRYVVYDVETPNALNDRMSAIGISVIEDGKIVKEFFSYVDPETHFDPFNVELTGIDEDVVRGKPTFPELWKEIEPIMSDGILVAHNAVFDLGVLKKCLEDYGITWKPSVKYACTVQIGRKLLPDMKHNLKVMCEYYGIPLDHHKADSDSHACAEILIKYFEEGVDEKSIIRTYRF